MKVREVAVEYGRTVSDGNYGSERVGVILTATVEPDESSGVVVEALGDLAKHLVSQALLEARSSGVRRALEAEASLGRH